MGIKERNQGIMRLHAAHVPVQTIAQDLGLAVDYVRRLLREQGAAQTRAKTGREPVNKNPTKASQVCSDYSTGMPTAEIAAKFSLSAERVRQILRANGVQVRARQPKNHGPQDQVRAERMLDMRRKGRTLVQIGAEFGVTGARVGVILRKIEGKTEKIGGNKQKSDVTKQVGV